MTKLKLLVDELQYIDQTETFRLLLWRTAPSEKHPTTASISSRCQANRHARVIAKMNSKRRIPGLRTISAEIGKVGESIYTLKAAPLTLRQTNIVKPPKRIPETEPMNSASQARMLPPTRPSVNSSPSK